MNRAVIYMPTRDRRGFVVDEQTISEHVVYVSAREYIVIHYVVAALTVTVCPLYLAFIFVHVQTEVPVCACRRKEIRAENCVAAVFTDCQRFVLVIRFVRIFEAAVLITKGDVSVFVNFFYVNTEELLVLRHFAERQAHVRIIVTVAA